MVLFYARDVACGLEAQRSSKKGFKPHSSSAADECDPNTEFTMMKIVHIMLLFDDFIADIMACLVGH